jgi:hypothetical protein
VTQERQDPPGPDRPIPGPGPRRPRRPATWMPPVLAVVIIAAIGIGFAVARHQPADTHHAALPSMTITTPGSPAPSSRPSSGPPSPSSRPKQVRAAVPPATGRSNAPAPTVTASPPAHQPDPSRPATYTAEEAYNRNGVPTFANYRNASKPGPVIPFGQVVQVACKLYDPSIPSTSPGGYWYRVDSSPWADSYYAVANTFLNGDPPDGPYTHYYDPAVPNC